MGIRIYQYGLRQPHGDGARLIFDQLRATTRYFNALVENERSQRKARYDLVRQLDPEAASLEDQYLELEQQLWSLRDDINGDKSRRGFAAHVDALEGKSQRGRKTDARKSAPEFVQQADLLKAKLDALRKVKNARAKVVREQPEYKHASAQMGVFYHARALRIYREHVTFGACAPSVVDDVRSDAFPAACSAPQKPGSRPKPFYLRPEFRRFDGDGIVGRKFPDGVRSKVKDGMPTSECKNWLQIDHVDPKAWQKSTPRGERRRLSRTTCQIRVGKTPGDITTEGTDVENKGEMLWVSFPMVMHRPLPASGEVRGARIVVRQHHNRWPRYYLQLTVWEPDAMAPTAQSADAVGIDLGWRRIDSTLNVDGNLVGGRVRVAVASDGTEVVMPERAVGALDKAEAIQAVRAKLQDAMQAALLEQLMPLTDAQLPAAIRRVVMRKSDAGERTPSSAQFRAVVARWGKSPKKFLRVMHAIRALPEVSPALASISALIVAWHRRDRHLHQYEDGLRRSGVLGRREVYRVAAAKLAQRYQFAVLEDLDISNLAKRGEAESDSGEARTAQNSRQKAAPSEFRLAVESAFAKAGGMVIRVPAAYTSVRCNDCGYAEPWKNKSELMHTCEGCGSVFDRDANAAKNIRADGEGIYSSPEAVSAYLAGKKAKVTKVMKPRKKVAKPAPNPVTQAAAPDALACFR